MGRPQFMFKKLSCIRTFGFQNAELLQGQKYHARSQKLRYKCIPNVYVWFKKKNAKRVKKLESKCSAEPITWNQYVSLESNVRIPLNFININCGLTL